MYVLRMQLNYNKKLNYSALSVIINGHCIKNYCCLNTQLHKYIIQCVIHLIYIMLTDVESGHKIYIQLF